jgi:superfamily II DNA or RNA helicase
VLYGLDHNLEVPIGTQDAGLLDSRINDEDEADGYAAELFEEEDDEGRALPLDVELKSPEDFRRRASEIYQDYRSRYQRKFKWLRPDLFLPRLSEDLKADSSALLDVLAKSGDWVPAKDAKLEALYDLLAKKHGQEKVIVFTQFADTVRYLEAQLAQRGLSKLKGVTGDSADPTALAWRFSPVSNNKRERVIPEDELRVLIATDVLSEGQNLQDCCIVVNYDLPWAIIRLVQRAGRIDRIGQKAERLLCYTFLPVEGVERIIRLRARIRQRLRENAEVVGADLPGRRGAASGGRRSG